MIDTQQILVNEFLLLKSSDKKFMDAFIKRLDDFVAVKMDAKISAISNSLKVIRANTNLQSFEKSCKMAESVFDYLKDITTWERTELHVLTLIMNYTRDYDRTYELFQEAMDILTDDEYVNDKSYNSVRICLQFNLMYRILRALRHEKNLNKKALKATFTDCYTNVMEVLVRNDSPDRYLLDIRRGFIEGLPKLISDSLRAIDKKENEALYLEARDEILEFLPLLDGYIGEDLSNILCGSIIRENRIKKGWTQEELAHRIDMSPSALSQLELGKTNATVGKLRNCAEALDINVCKLIGHACPKKESQTGTNQG